MSIDLLTTQHPGEAIAQYARRRLAEILPDPSTIRPITLHRSGASQVVRIEAINPQGGWPLDITHMIVAAQIGFTYDSRNKYAQGLRLSAHMLEEFPHVLGHWVHDNREAIQWK